MVSAIDPHKRLSLSNHCPCWAYTQTATFEMTNVAVVLSLAERDNASYARCTFRSLMKKVVSSRTLRSAAA